MTADRQGPPAVLIAAKRGQGKSTLMRRLVAQRRRAVTIDPKGTPLPGAPPQLTAHGLAGLDIVIGRLATLARQRQAGRIDLVWIPREGRTLLSDEQLADATRRLITAVEATAIASGWITLVVEEAAVIATHRRTFGVLLEEIAIARRGADLGFGGWSLILTAQGIRYMPPGLRAQLAGAYLGPIAPDETSYLATAWKISRDQVTALRDACQRMAIGEFIHYDFVTHEVTIVPAS